jgi:hypothetical protein
MKRILPHSLRKRRAAAQAGFLEDHRRGTKVREDSLQHIQPDKGGEQESVGFDRPAEDSEGSCLRELLPEAVQRDRPAGAEMPAG